MIDSIIQYWHDPHVPPEISRLMSTVRELNPEMRHVVVDEAGARKLIGEHFTAREVAAFDACAVPAMQADYFRYCAVHALGGVYIDADFRCLRPLRDMIEANGGQFLVRVGPKEHLMNGFFAFRAPLHPLPRLAVDVATANVERRIDAHVNIVTGPWVFNGLEALRRIGSIEAAREYAAGQTIEQFTASMLDAVGSFERVEEAFAHVRIVLLDEAWHWIGRSEAPLAYKQTDSHWIHWRRNGRSIFRDATA